MEADWEVEVGPGAPVIDACWAGLVNLGLEPARAHLLPEVAGLPALANALIALNAPQSPLFTSKCDVWMLDQVDPLEFAAQPALSAIGLACYIDLLACEPNDWRKIEPVIAWCKTACAGLHAIELSRCRVDLIIRQAIVKPDQDGIGVTAYLAACGASVQSANERLADALGLFAASIASAGSGTALEPRYNEKNTGE